MRYVWHCNYGFIFRYAKNIPVLLTSLIRLLILLVCLVGKLAMRISIVSFFGNASSISITDTVVEAYPRELRIQEFTLADRN